MANRFTSMIKPSLSVTSSLLSPGFLALFASLKMKFLTPVALTLLSSSDSSSSGQFLYVSEYFCFFINSHLLSTALFCLYNSVLWGFFGFQTVKILWKKIANLKFLFKVDFHNVCVCVYIYIYETKGGTSLFLGGWNIFGFYIYKWYANNCWVNVVCFKIWSGQCVKLEGIKLWH